MFRPSTSRGRPALGCAASFTVATLGHPFDRFQHRRGSHAAIDADHAGAELFEVRHEGFGRRAVERVAIFFSGDLGDDREVRQAAHRSDRGADLVDIAERLEHEEVNAPLEQGLRLFAEVFLGFVYPGLAPRLDADTQRANGSRHINVFAGRVPCNPRPLEVDGVGAVRDTKRPQLDPVGPERIGLDDVGAGPDVGLVDLRDKVGLGKVQLVEGTVEEDPLGVQHRAHGPVADEHALVHRVEEWWPGQCSSLQA